MINQGTGADTAEAVTAGAEDGTLRPIVGRVFLYTAVPRRSSG